MRYRIQVQTAWVRVQETTKKRFRVQDYDLGLQAHSS
jgi:hypothetical protein